jgi:transposase
MHPLLQPIPEEQLITLNRRDAIVLLRGEQQIRLQMQEELERLEALKKELEDKIVKIDGRFVTIRNKLFGRSSEKSPPPAPKPSEGKKNPRRRRQGQKKSPSERYPNIPIVDKEVGFEKSPHCRTCGEEMASSSMSEVSEYLTVIPKQYMIIRQHRQKYRCPCCHGDIQTAPPVPRIKPGSTYSDEIILDAALSKFCDLIPMERYCAMAARQGVSDLPPNSLIAATHHLADFVAPAVEKVHQEVLALTVLHADETPHRMLEGDEKSRWYLWGFSGEHSAYFECHDTRSGDVAAALLQESRCEVLVSDVFSGYKKAVSKANEYRKSRGVALVETAYCNAHARRKFKEAEAVFPDKAALYVEVYRKIYKLESKDGDASEKLEVRRQTASLFKDMAIQASVDLGAISNQSLLAKALHYFLNNYDGLTLHLSNPDIPIDNNRQERVLRNPVIGRKTWYGTHSKRGARTTAMLFTLVESCKLCKVNPREYLPALVRTMHDGKPAFTPAQYRAPPPDI